MHGGSDAPESFMTGYDAVALPGSSHVVSGRDSEVGSRGARCRWGTWKVSGREELVALS